MLKRVLPLLIAVVWIAFAAACAGDGGDTSSSVASSLSPAPSNTETSSTYEESSSVPSPQASSAVTSAPSAGASSKVTSSTAKPSTSSSSAPPTSSPSTSQTPDNRVKIGETFSEQDVVVTVYSITESAGEVAVKIYVKNTSVSPHPVNMVQRYHLVNADGERISAVRIEDLTGADVRTKTLATGESLEATAYFTPFAGFDPVTFSYTYDIMGFRSVRYKIK